MFENKNLWVISVITESMTIQILMKFMFQNQQTGTNWRKLRRYQDEIERNLTLMENQENL